MDLSEKYEIGSREKCMVKHFIICAFRRKLLG